MNSHLSAMRLNLHMSLRQLTGGVMKSLRVKSQQAFIFYSMKRAYTNVV